MSELIESIPEARLLLMSLRSVGYTEESAIADIIDNSISADATKIDITFDWNRRRIVIADDGFGMDADSLIKNMRIGSADPGEIRASKDLGRFGMGMKTAAFSLGKRLTVITKTSAGFANATWDLDEVLQIGWQLIIQEDYALSEFYGMFREQGTVIIIEKLDRLIDKNDIAKSKTKFFRILSNTEKHISLIFHRFIEEDGLVLTVNGNVVEAWNPFIPENRATQELAEEPVYSDDGLHEVTIQPYILPHKTKFASPDDFKKAGGPKGWNYHQGIYLYRNKRLIVYGTWFDYLRKEPAYNLARIKVDISSSGDELWNIDIKKSTASLPLFMRDTIEHVIEVATEKSATVYNSRGTYSKNPTIPNLSYVWEQRKSSGKYSFHINKKHILLKSIRSQLDEEGKNSLSAYLSLVENFAPFMVSGVTASLQSSEREPFVDLESLESKMQINELKKYVSLFRTRGFTNDEIRSTLLEMPNYRHLKQVIIDLTEET